MGQERQVFTVELLELQRGMELHARQLEITSLLLELAVAEDGLSSMLLGLVIHMVKFKFFVLILSIDFQY
jgi:hypothetical protein